MRADGILFDKDGTLFQFGATWEAWARSVLDRLTGGDVAQARALGAAIEYDYDAGVFDPHSVAIAGTPKEVVAALSAHVDLSGAALESLLNDEAAHAPQVEAVPLVPFMDRLRARGLKLGVATNDAEAPALAHLGAAGVTDRFDYIVGYDSGHGFKPAPGQCLGFIEKTGLAPERTVMVGDSLHDLHAGRAAGMQTVGVLTGMARTEELAPHADTVLPHIGHLPAWLEG